MFISLIGFNNKKNNICRPQSLKDIYKIKRKWNQKREDTKPFCELTNTDLCLASIGKFLDVFKYHYE